MLLKYIFKYGNINKEGKKCCQGNTGLKSAVEGHRPQTCINLSPQFPQDKYLVNHVSACKHLFYYNTITFLQLLICLFKKMTSQPVPKTS